MPASIRVLSLAGAAAFGAAALGMAAATPVMACDISDPSCEANPSNLMNPSNPINPNNPANPSNPNGFYNPLSPNYVFRHSGSDAETGGPNLLDLLGGASGLTEPAPGYAEAPIPARHRRVHHRRYEPIE